MSLLLPLHDYESVILLDALTLYASREEADGDVLGHAPLADKLAERVRELKTLSSAGAEQYLRVLGLGRYNDRPQG